MMNKFYKITTQITIYILIALFMYSCASLGSKTLYNNLRTNDELEIKTICLVKPTFENFDFDNNDADNYYFEEVTNSLKEEGIDVQTDKSTEIEFDNFDNTSTFLKTSSIKCEYILSGKVERLTSMGMTRDFKVEYKLISSIDGKLKYHSKYSTTFGKTYVITPLSGWPTEEQLMRDAIKLGLRNLRKEILNK